MSCRVVTGNGKRSYAYVGPVAWNNPPSDIRLELNSSFLKTSLKTFLFTQACNVLGLCFLCLFTSYFYSFYRFLGFSVTCVLTVVGALQIFIDDL